MTPQQKKNARRMVIKDIARTLDIKPESLTDRQFLISESVLRGHEERIIECAQPMPTRRIVFNDFDGFGDGYGTKV